MLNTNKPSSRPSRKRLITDEELRALWSALTDDDYSDIIRLLIYTGARKSEIGGLTWKEIDLVKAQMNIPGTRMKNGKSPSDSAKRPGAGHPAETSAWR